MSATLSISVVCRPLLSAAECERLIASAADDSWEAGTILTPAGVNTGPTPLRRCRQSGTFDRDIATLVEEQVARLGGGHFGFQLSGPSPHDPSVLVRYACGDHFTWHIDNGDARAPFGTRKLSYVVQLSDPREYRGGDLELAVYAQRYGGEVFAGYRERLRERGALIVFASFHLHRVRRLASGTRHALVGWMHGPPFR